MCEYFFRILSLKTKDTSASSWMFDFVSLSNYWIHRRNVCAFINCLGLIIYYKLFVISSKIMHVDSVMIRQQLKLRPNHSSLRARKSLQTGGSVHAQNAYLSLAWEAHGTIVSDYYRNKCVRLF